MSSRKKKEEERIIERIIRSLSKLPENRRCINCSDLGPKYVCTTFWTFVCSSCCGIHRKFTHRVKSVSMAKFNAEEVSALQAGGNERAREIYFKEWDPQLHSFPDRSNQNKLRDFIKRVYVDRKFTGERSMGRLAMVKGGDREVSSEWHSIERPSLGGRIEDRSLKDYINERGSPHYKLNTIRSLGHRNHPVNFEIVDDRFRDDQFGSHRRPEICRASNEQSRAKGVPPVSQKGRQKISLPEVHPGWDTLSENGSSLQSCTSSLASNAQGPSSASAKELSQASSKVAQDNNSGVGSQAFQKNLTNLQ
ncbi:putative ADP-ribosylation factor GTPase-activating protein AGD14 [Camellia lanceoleosa]|uniref:ADP-ribosylation factor GTPase-activating protein AGD14 n=1 Tax=Camellia lanceoleosa TaxID=1840588 RepID=A0ACC0G394_9ERIC|nr:putative ADP-ribosylation factor GTPase-activating protein AGD14 [Camellia lanceoleosa]